MNDLIDRAELKRTVKALFGGDVQQLLKIVDLQPKVDAESVIHAYWEKECRSQIMFPSGEAATLIERKCSNCHLWSDKEIVTYYPSPAERCSKCGALMDEKEKE